MAITFLLPTPPSLNSIWRSTRAKKGQYRSAEYVKWITVAGNMLNAMRIPQIEPPYEVDYAFGRKLNKDGSQSKKHGDLGNYEKATGDILQTCGVITNDSAIEDIRLHWASDVHPGWVRISIKSLGE